MADAEVQKARHSLYGAFTVIVVAAVWLLLSPILGHMGPPWPCAIAGGIMLVCALMLIFEPWQHVGWGVIVVALSAGIALMGKGAVIPGLIGALGGVSAIVVVVNLQKKP